MVPPITMFPEPQMLPATDKASAGLVVPIPTFPVVKTLKMLVEVATEKRVAGVVVPMPMLPLSRITSIGVVVPIVNTPESVVVPIEASVKILKVSAIKPPVVEALPEESIMKLVPKIVEAAMSSPVVEALPEESIWNWLEEPK